MARPFLETHVKPHCGDNVDPRQVLVDAYEEKGSLAQVALMFGADRSTISKNLKECRLMNYAPQEVSHA